MTGKHPTPVDHQNGLEPFVGWLAWRHGACLRFDRPGSDRQEAIARAAALAARDGHRLWLTVQKNCKATSNAGNCRGAVMQKTAMEGVCKFLQLLFW